MPNRLAEETSPYLLQHADNPVDWWPWGEAAFEEARRTNRPVLLSVGYAACHWCHVMAHESFEDDGVAEVMNRLFVNIKVDREERPDVDQIYMSALHALGEQGGWPLTMFLTPAGEPFWGGTYFPKTTRYGRPGFVDLLQAVSGTFHAEPDRIAHNTRALVDHLTRTTTARPGAALTADVLAAAVSRLAGIVDRRNGGLRGAPKFPQPTLFGLFFRESARTGDPNPAGLACFTLDRMSRGGIYDHLAGGFARYSVDDRWLVPHFEKMLYDNGQLLSLLARAHLVTGADSFRRRIGETIDWLVSEMTVEGGAFAASLDADTDGHEGLTYVWTPDEVEAVLGDEAAAFNAAYDITADGNFEGRSIPNRLGSESDDDDLRFVDARSRLKAVRDGRPQPGRDDKVLADWNALVIRGLVDAARADADPRALDLARAAYRFVAGAMADADGRLAHATRAGRFTRPGLATDHAGMALAAIALAEATGDHDHLLDADMWLRILDQRYRADDGLYHLSADDVGDLIVRPKSIIDEATPNHHGLIAEASVRLHLLTGEPAHLDRADRLIEAAAGSALENVLGAASLLTALSLRLDMPVAVVVGPDASGRAAVARAVHRRRPDAVLFASESTAGLKPGHPAAGKEAIGGETTLYLCRDGSCSLPAAGDAAIAAAIA